MENYKLITDNKSLEKFVNYTEQKIDKIALDFEGDSNLHSYGIHLCLIQIYDGTGFWLIDPKSEIDLNPLKRIFENDSILKIMFAADFDVKLIKHTLGFGIINIYDLQRAAIMIGDEKVGLNKLIDKYIDDFDIKGKSYQKANWNKRPLSDRMIFYALEDVKYLIDLYDRINPVIEKNHLRSELCEQNKDLENLVFNEKNSYLDIKGAKGLNREERSVLKKLHKNRDKIARQINRPVFHLIKDNELVQLAKELPSSKYNWDSFFQKFKLLSNYKQDFQI